jgi:predicted amidohydrolase
MEWKAHAPDTVKPPIFQQDGGSLSIELPVAESVGMWTGEYEVKPESGYRISAWAEQPADAKNNVSLVLSWCPEDPSLPPVQRDYVEFHDETPSLRRFDEIFTAPAGCVRLEIMCMFKWRLGRAVFRDIQVEACAPIPKRMVRLVAANIKPASPATLEKNLKIFEDCLAHICSSVNDLDLIVFPECHTYRGVRAPLSERAEALPGGVTFNLCSRYAAQYKTWIVANIHERAANGQIHNTAFIVNREGQLHGCYRKVHLTTGEMASGIIPGSEFPAFDLDFGRIGIAICWDNWFCESARQLRLSGAELLVFPLAGDAKESHWSKTWSTRCIDNSLPMVVSICDAKVPSAILDRDGTWLAATMERGGFAFAEIDLNERKRSFWLSVGPSFGDPYQLYLKERRPESYR